jgi:hypothetical protein
MDRSWRACPTATSRFTLGNSQVSRSDGTPFAGCHHLVGLVTCTVCPPFAIRHPNGSSFGYAHSPSGLSVPAHQLLPPESGASTAPDVPRRGPSLIICDICSRRDIYPIRDLLAVHTFPAVRPTVHRSPGERVRPPEGQVAGHVKTAHIIGVVGGSGWVGASALTAAVAYAVHRRPSPARSGRRPAGRGTRCHPQPRVGVRCALA